MSNLIIFCVGEVESELQDVGGGRGLVAREREVDDALYLIGSSHPTLSEFVRADPGVEPRAFNLEYS